MTAPGTLLGTIRTLSVLKRIPAGLLLDGDGLGAVSYTHLTLPTKA